VQVNFNNEDLTVNMAKFQKTNYKLQINSKSQISQPKADQPLAENHKPAGRSQGFRRRPIK
jgi:hypothetical protein